MSITIINVFKQLQFTYNGKTGKPSGYNYTQMKDFLKWSGISPKEYAMTINQMFYRFIGSL